MAAIRSNVVLTVEVLLEVVRTPGPWTRAKTEAACELLKRGVSTKELAAAMRAGIPRD